MRNVRQVAETIGGQTTNMGRRAIGAAMALGLVACASRGPRTAMGVAPELITGHSVTSVALLGSLHVSDSVRSIADSALTAAVRTVCPSATVLPADATERQLALRGVIVPRRLSANFAREARTTLNADLLLAPTATGLIYDTRSTVAGVVDAIGRPAQSLDDDRAGMTLEGWDLRSAEKAVWVVRTHASENSWTMNPVRMLQNATRDAVERIAPLCRPARSARQSP